MPKKGPDIALILILAVFSQAPTRSAALKTRRP